MEWLDLKISKVNLSIKVNLETFVVPVGDPDMKLEWFLRSGSMMFTISSYDTIVIFSGEPLLFKSSFTPVYDFGFVGLAVNKVSDHHHHQQCDRHHWSASSKTSSSPIDMIRCIRTTLESLWFVWQTDMAQLRWQGSSSSLIIIHLHNLYDHRH